MSGGNGGQKAPDGAAGGAGIRYRSEAMNPKAYRLPRDLWPLAYRIELDVAPDREDFGGAVEMELRVDAPSAEIVLHAKALQIEEVTVHQGGASRPSHWSLDADREVLQVALDEALESGPATLQVRYRGALSKNMHGLYLAADGDERAVCSQCEATDARAIFPCFDEPEFKASLAWTVRAPQGMVVLTNGALLEVENDEAAAASVWRFAPTEPVSSYLAALCLGDFESSGIAPVREIPTQVWALRGKAEHTEFARDFTVKLIPWYETYFGQPYPYGKYDQVAVPGFDAGAMENIGLVLFRQNYLLMKPGSASWGQEKIIALVIAHELAHMWFGNLVTMKWWDDLWLNEAFAEWFAHKAVAAIAPDYQVWDDFQGQKARAMGDDALPTTHAIWNEVQTPAEALEMFDVITYQKGCAVMRMLESYLGADDFASGIRAYMAAHRGKNAEGRDLWSALQAASGAPVDALMQSWVRQPGFPVLRLSWSDGALSVSQRRFYSSPARAANPGDQRWQVPVVLRYADDAGEHSARFLLSEAEQTESLPVQGALRWCVGNAGELGFYRVEYDAGLQSALAGHATSVLSPVEQMGWLSDQWALLRNGRLDFAGIWPAIEALSSSTDHHVLKTVAGCLASVEHLLEVEGNEAAWSAFRGWVRAKMAPQADRLGFVGRSGEPRADEQSRGTVLSLLASTGADEAALERIRGEVAKEQETPESVDPNLAGALVAIVARAGDEKTHQRYLEVYQARRRASAAPQLSLRYLYALPAFRDPAAVDATLRAIEDGLVPQEAVGSMLSALFSVRAAQAAAWTYLTTHWAALRPRVGDMGLSRLVEAVGQLPFERRGEVEAFFAAHDHAGAERALERALERMDAFEEFRQRVTPDLLRHFSG